MKQLISLLLITMTTICMDKQQNALPVSHQNNRRNIDLSGMTKEEVKTFIDKTHANIDSAKRAEIVTKALAKRKKDIKEKRKNENTIISIEFIQINDRSIQEE